MSELRVFTAGKSLAHYFQIIQDDILERRPLGKMTMITVDDHQYATGWLVDRLVEVAQNHYGQRDLDEPLKKVLVIHKGHWSKLEKNGMRYTLSTQLAPLLGELRFTPMSPDQIYQKVALERGLEFEFYSESFEDRLFDRKDLSSVIGVVYVNFTHDDFEKDRKEARTLRQLGYHYGFFTLLRQKYSKDARELLKTDPQPQEFLDGIRGKGYQRNRHLVQEVDNSILMVGTFHEDKVLLTVDVEKARGGI